MLIERLDFKSSSLRLRLFTHERIDALNILHEILNAYLSFKKHFSS